MRVAIRPRVRAELANGVYDSALIRLEEGSAVGRE